MAARVLAVCAHPDDELLGPGATLARHAARGDEVSVLLLSGGAASRATRGEGRKAVEEQQRRLREASQRVADTLGFARVHHLEFPDNAFDSLPLLRIVQAIEAAVASCVPDVVYTHWPGDLNIDHVLTHRAVLTAFRPTGGPPPREIWCFETPSATEWSFGAGDPFAPNRFTDIGDWLEAKLRALALYESELRSPPHPRSIDMLRARAAMWGSMAGLEAAETFALARQID